MELIHYTCRAPRNKWKLRPLHVSNRNHMKPKGGLWTSPRDSLYGWKEWCLAENYRQKRHPFRHPVFLTLKTHNLLTIDSMADLDQIPFRQVFPEIEMLVGPDYELLVKQGVDAIYLTTQGEEATRFGMFERDDHRNLYGWDCETVLILNERCIEHYA